MSRLSVLACAIVLMGCVEAGRTASEAAAAKARWQTPGRTVVVEGGQGRVAGLWWLDGAGLLRAVWNAPLTGDGSTVLTLPADGRWAALSGGTLRVFIHGDDDAAAELPVGRADNPPPPGKPMAHGVLRQAGQPPARWYVDDDHTLVWNGQPWIPFGGMYCSPVLTYHHTTRVPLEERWKEHHAVLDQIQAAGFHELYINLDHGTPELKQAVIDDLNRRDIRFGWQLPRGNIGPIQGYLVRNSRAQSLIVGRCETPGKLSVTLPRQRIISLLIVGAEDGSVRHFAQPIDLSDPNHRPGFIQIDVEVKTSDKAVAMTVDIPDLPAGSYYVIPCAAVKAHATDAWGRTDQIIARHAWLAEMRWGEGFRFVVDPMGNEDGLYNEAEPVRIATEAFNRDYADWLQKRYASVEALTEAWRLPAGSIESYEHAARLIPLRDTESPWGQTSMRWIDPVRCAQVSTIGGLGQGWLDYVEGVRDTYANCRDAVARGVKRFVDVPVVFKRVSPWVNPETVNRTPGGFDGVGLELYPTSASMVSGGLATGRAEAELSSQTMWLVATEMGYSPATDNRGIIGFPSERYVDRFVRTTAAMGGRGFFFFGWRLEPYDTWRPMQLHRLPEQLGWIRSARQNVLSHWPARWPIAHSFPEGNNWWYKANGRSLTRYTAVLDDGPSQIRQSALLLPAGEAGPPPLWAISSSVVLPQAEARLVNLASVESAHRYGPQVAAWIEQGRKVIYLGGYPAGAGLPGLEDHFTAERIRLGEETLQVLQVHPGDRVLGRHDGKPWAKRSGNLLIVARWSARMIGDGDRMPTGLDPAWVRELLAAQGRPDQAD